MTMTNEDARIALITSNAIRFSGQKVIDDIRITIEAAEATARTLREDGEALITEIETHTNLFADRVNAYVANCHEAVSMLQAHQSKMAEEDHEPPVTNAATNGHDDRLPSVPLLITESDLAEKE